MQIRLTLEDKQQGPKFRKSMERMTEKVRAAVRGAAEDAADEILARGADDIESAGNFGERWTEGLHADVKEGGGNIVVSVSHDVPYWTVFEYGAVIEGDPLLWIPFSFAEDAQGLWPRAYDGPLFRVDRKTDGLPMLFTWEPGEAGSAEPKYFGKESVTEPQKFHLRQIIAQVARELREYYKDRMR